MTRLLAKCLAAAALALPVLASASVIQFNATLNGASEVPSNGAIGTGVATLSYDTLTNKFDFSLAAFDLSGGSDGKAANSAHIHGQANTSQTALALVNILASPFLALNSGSTLLVGGNDVAAPAGLIGSNGNYPTGQTFLAILQSGLAYVNVHTTDLPGGEIRGQLIQVTAVPEAESYAMMLAGLGLIGFVMHRRRRG